MSKGAPFGGEKNVTVLKMARGYVFLVVMLSLIVGVSTTITKRSKKQPLCRNNMPYDPTKARLVVMNEPIIGKEVLCDTQNGWIYIQRRGYGNQSFYQLWSRYVFGFGDVYADHWLGLEAIHNLTYSGHADLVIRVVDNGRYYDLYVSGFKVKDAKHYYQMTYEMILGGSLSHEAFERSKSCYFTTKDEDHDTLVGEKSDISIHLCSHLFIKSVG
ncbi:hypothetical protein RRG08_019917 [Elysia crispata]|uniref:Fibrinogen C-terminal domain-containing protein n=1 Tax=Elysia crispata TaxID=231223 RepID=A0AAE1ATQ7_9GAST|nr:hypothetical protein RRG08_019917 [Elysia crispata]